MNYLKFSTALLFTFFFATGLFANNAGRIQHCPAGELSESMRSKLNLSHAQMQSVRRLNREYCFSRKNILDDPEKAGKNTALLASWDRWVQQLSRVLTATQMESFMQWQAGVDQLSLEPN